MSLAAHPATSLFPLMGGDALRELADDIAAHGLQHPVVLYEGMVLDGRNRVAACELVGKPAHFVQWEQDGATPTEWVIATNLHRRHLTTGQRAAIAVEALPLLEAEAKERQGRRTDLPTSDSKEIEVKQGRSNDIAAKQFGIGHASVGRAKQLKREAPDAFEKVKAGEMALGTALRESGLPDGQPPKVTQGRRTRAPKRPPPVWQRHFTKWCRRVLPEDRAYLLDMSVELHTALGHLDLTCTENE